MTTYSITTCQNMIRHYQAETTNWTKPESWRALARISVAEWQQKLERAS